MVTGRVELGARVFEIYSGVGGLFPLYIKEIHVMAGAEFLKTDFIFLDKKYTNESVSSFYGGLKFKMTMAYALPFTLDVIYTQIESPSGTTIGKSLISISGGGIWQ